MKTGIRNLWAIVGAVEIVVAAIGSLHAQQPSAAPQEDAKSPAAKGSDAKPSDPSALWQSIDAEVVVPNPPKEWQNSEPSQEVIQAWIAKEGQRLLAVADRARDFAAQYPQDAHAAAAREKERQALVAAVQFSRDEALGKRLDAVDAALLSDPSLPAPSRFSIRLAQLQRKAKSRDEAEQMARALVKEFPDNPQAALVLLQVAKAGGSDHLRPVAEEIVKGSAPEEAKSEAKKMLSLTEMVGKPLALQFTALDGQAIDLQKLHGKVVLVDFWATWCMPCVAELPNVKAAYTKLHDKGFEIVGISFDQNKDALMAFLKAKEMPWPQYFDGQGWQNRFGKEFGIDTIPSMWLVDKKGILRDQDASEGLADKVEKLLAEP